MDNLLFDIRPPDKIVERAMVIRVAVSPAYCSVTRGIRARAAVESVLGLPWNQRSVWRGIRTVGGSPVRLSSITIQSTCESGPCADYDGYKRKRGSKVHIAVDTLGQLLAVHVTPANE
jgi:hypothetical protein